MVCCVIANKSATEGVQEVRQVEEQAEKAKLQDLVGPRTTHDHFRAHKLGRCASRHALPTRLCRGPH